MACLQLITLNGLKGVMICHVSIVITIFKLLLITDVHMYLCIVAYTADE